MREINFRCWNTAAKAMYPQEHFALRCDGVWMQRMPNDVWLENKATTMIFMQFTGLKDKNRKEIYESDLLKVYPMQIETKNGKEVGIFHVYEVIFNQARFEYEIRLRNSEATMIDVNTTRFPLRVVQDFSFEVIGNIYEHPELLEEGKDTQLEGF